jgi:internalin A
VPFGASPPLALGCLLIFVAGRLQSLQITPAELTEEFLMLTRLTFLAVAASILASSAVQAAGEIFPDPGLEAAIKAVLKKQGKDTIKDEDLKNVYQVTAKDKGIKNLAGLEKCTNIVLLDFAGNEIVDLKPIAGLKNLQSLDLSGNAIKDAAPLKELVKLQYLQLEDNQVADVSVLSGHKKLSALYLSRNKVADVKPLEGLPKLSSLYLEGNQVKDVSPLSKIRWLANLDLQGNQIEDVSPLAGLTELRFTFLQNNKIKDFGPLVEMAKKDTAGEKRFAPYWKLYLDGNPIDAGQRDGQVAELKKAGVRVNWQPKK